MTVQKASVQDQEAVQDHHLVQGAVAVALGQDPILNHDPDLIRSLVPSLIPDLHSPEVAQDQHNARVPEAVLVRIPLVNSPQRTNAMGMIKILDLLYKDFLTFISNHSKCVLLL